MYFWPSSIPNIQPADSVSAAVVNRPINALTERTTYLRAILDNTTSGEFTYSANMPVSSDAVEGNIVAYDVETNSFVPAKAEWDSTLDNYGALRPKSSALPAGILVSKLTPYTGSIVTGGLLRDFASLQGMFGSTTPDAGIYYLSGTTAGQVSATPAPLEMLVLTYTEDGSVILHASRPESSTHDHFKYLLTSTKWEEANSANFPGYTIPAAATYGYSIADDPDVAAAFTLYPGYAVLTNATSGVDIPYAYYELNQNTLWWTQVTAPASDMYMWMTHPNTHGPGIVRSATTTTTDRLGISLTNGLLTIDAKPYVVTSEEDESVYAVKDISLDGITKGKIVTRVSAGTGLTLTSDNNYGEVELSLSSATPSLLDASVIDLNNAMQTTIDGDIYVVFPKGQSTSMTCVAPLGVFTSVTKKAVVWAWVRGSYGGTFNLPALNVTIRMFNKATSAGVAIPSTVATTLPGIANSSYSNIYLMQAISSACPTAISEGLVRYTLSLNNTGAFDVCILRQGVTLV